jgi:hypothetical protein
VIRRIAPATLIVAALALFASSQAPAASAHERRNVAGTFDFVVGFSVEPALVEEPNGIDVRITDTQTKEPVVGAEKTLKAEVIVGGQTKTFDLRARFGQPGAYTADLLPTKTGTWACRFFGTINNTPVDERVESGPGRFNDGQAKTALQFPVTLPSMGELATQNERAGHNHGEAGAMMGAASPDVERALERADAARTLALTFGGVGVLLGILGVGLAVMVLRSNSALRAPGATSSPARLESEPV